MKYHLLALVLIAILLGKYFTRTEQVEQKSDIMPNISIRPFNRLGGANHGWLNTRHHFSFADYFDMNRMNWGALRVINDDIVQPGSGFPPHPHRNMEIITYILKPNFHPATDRVEGGEGVRHRDNTGSDGITLPGDVQVMSVGSEGVVHSEFHGNPKSKDTVNLFQIWIMPDQRLQKTTWGTRHFPRNDTANKFITFASGISEDKDGDALSINSISRVVGVTLSAGGSATYKLGQNRLAYAVVGQGECKVNGLKAGAHDGIAVEDTSELTFTSDEGAEIIMVDTHPI